MHRTNEANLSSITANLEKLRECFGKWVKLSIETECKVIVTSEESGVFRMGKREIKLGELCKDSSREVALLTSQRRQFVVLDDDAPLQRCCTAFAPLVHACLSELVGELSQYVELHSLALLHFFCRLVRRHALVDFIHV